MLKALLVLEFLVMCKKAKVNFKIYDVTDRTLNNYKNQIA